MRKDKIILLLLMIPTFALVLTGCNKVQETKKENTTKTIILADDNYGLRDARG